jgi:5'-nucleotidase
VGFLKQILDRESFPAHTLLSANLPAIPPEDVRGIRVTSLGQRRYADSITKAEDPKGRPYFWIGGDISTWTGGEDADYKAVEEGFISVTPLHLDLTNYTILEEIRRWDLAL